MRRPSGSGEGGRHTGPACPGARTVRSKPRGTESNRARHGRSVLAEGRRPSESGWIVELEDGSDFIGGLPLGASLAYLLGYRLCLRWARVAQRVREGGQLAAKPPRRLPTKRRQSALDDPLPPLLSFAAVSGI